MGKAHTEKEPKLVRLLKDPSMQGFEKGKVQIRAYAKELRKELEKIGGISIFAQYENLGKSLVDLIETLEHVDHTKVINAQREIRGVYWLYKDPIVSDRHNYAMSGLVGQARQQKRLCCTIVSVNGIRYLEIEKWYMDEYILKYCIILGSEIHKYVLK